MSEQTEVVDLRCKVRSRERCLACNIGSGCPDRLGAPESSPAAPPKATKHDGGKPRIGLIPAALIFALGRVLTYGALKYGEWNWVKGMAWSRPFDACQRHLWVWSSGEDLDPESGMPHLWHAVCELSFLVAYEAQGLGTDDRYKEPS